MHSRELRTEGAAPAFINAVGIAVPRHDVHEAFLSFVPGLLESERDRKLFQRMAGRSGIAHRFSSLMPALAADRLDADAFYRPDRFPATAQRMARFEADAPALADAALEDLGERLGRDWREGVTHVIVATCTGFYAPGLEAYLIAQHGLRPDVERTTVGFMGCNAAINAFKLARHIVRSEPAARVLVLNVELCTLHLQSRMPLETALMFLLFADGAAATLITAEPEGFELTGFASAIAPGSGDKITWRIGDDGFDMWLSGEVPKVISASLSAHVAALRERDGLDRVDVWAVHPGGRTVLDAVEGSLGLAPDEMTASREVLRDYGNMSSATLCFVLRRLLDEGRSARAGIALGFGPGVSIESMAFRDAAG